jgi:hypothetical protein
MRSYKENIMTRPMTTQKLTVPAQPVALWCALGHDFNLQANTIYPSEALI